MPPAARRPASRQIDSQSSRSTSIGKCRPCCSVEPVGRITTGCRPMASFISAQVSRLYRYSRVLSTEVPILSPFCSRVRLPHSLHIQFRAAHLDQSNTPGQGVSDMGATQLNDQHVLT